MVQSTNLFRLSPNKLILNSLGGPENTDGKIFISIGQGGMYQNFGITKQLGRTCAGTLQRVSMSWHHYDRQIKVCQCVQNIRNRSTQSDV